MPTEFNNNNISYLIRDLFKEFNRISSDEINGLSITLNGFDSNNGFQEDPTIRRTFDALLEENQKQSIHTVANTFFPVNLWNPNHPRKLLYDRYSKVSNQIKKCSLNRHGIYFERMINYKNGLNQIEEILGFYKTGNRRRSAFQISIWDPEKDLKNTRMRGFPCMQHIVLSCVRNRLIVFAFFATQYLFERAYGNFLGLCNLGKFIGHELELPLKAVKCYIGVEQLEISKTELYRINELI